MGLYRHFPYSNFHEMNMDEIIKIVKDMLDEWTEYHVKLDQLYNDISTAFDSFKAEFDEFIASIDVEEEFNKALNKLIEDGTFTATVRPIIIGETRSTATAWLTEHITQPTSPVVDTSLSISGAAADAKVTGDKITDVELNLLNFNNYNLCDKMNHENKYQTGINFEWINFEMCHITGDNPGSSAATCDLWINRNELPWGITAGSRYKASLDMVNQYTVVRMYIYDYSPGRTNILYDSSVNDWFVVPADCTGMIVRLYVVQNFAVDEIVRPYISKEALNFVKDTFVESIDGTSTDESTMRNMYTKIQYLLNTYKYCKLGKGNFLISAAISLPEGAVLEGSGFDTKLLVSQGDAKFAVTMTNKSIIKNLTITGNFNDLTHADLGSAGSRYGIAYRAETGKTNDSCIIDNVNIENFTGAGIYSFNTGAGVDDGLFVNNTMIKNCYYGLWIPGSAEYSRFENMQITYCTIACLNNAGNNNFTNCIFHGYEKGFVINGTAGNRGHGGCVNCAFNHIGNNNGVAIEIENLIYGFTFTGCNIWYGGINITESSGIIIANSILRLGNPINITNGDTIAFNGNMFMLNTELPQVFNITNNNKVKFNNNFDSQSGNLVSA